MLRSVLLTDQSPHITFDSAFTSYTTSPDSVTAHFANGTSVTGSLLVGADGIRSKVAAQLVGKLAEATDLGFRIAYGKTPLTPEVEEKLNPNMKKGTSFVVDTTTVNGHRLLLVSECMRFNHPDAPENYIFWALASSREGFEEEDATLLAKQGQAAADLSSRLTAKWDPSIRIIFDKQTVNESAVMRVSTSHQEHTAVWETDRRVTVLGDAIHCMPPTGGQGANSAMYDAGLLGQVLDKAAEDGSKGWSVETIRTYEDAMRYNIGDIVGLACIGATYVIGGGPKSG
jgi:2-polyprenyl-6-methoxyphenol hydroxylase-like FAD-dependent oxidoreductase